MEVTDELYVTNRDEWRAWLRNNHTSQKEIWLIYYKKNTGRPSIPYSDSVEEALCFGWIDSLIKKLDDERYARKFTPRKEESSWSSANKRRAEKMIKTGKMTEAGLLRITGAKRSGEWYKTTRARTELTVPAYVEAALGKNKKALENFNKLAPSYKRHYVGWIASAKREETRARRLTEALRLLEKNEKLGMK